MKLGFDVVAARPKGRTDDDDAPVQASMRGDKKISRNPSTDQKKVRRRQARQKKSASLQEETHTMTTTHREAQLLEAMRRATGEEQRRLAAELGQLRARTAAEVEMERETDIANAVIEEAMTPVAVHSRSTAATDWLDDVSEEPAEDVGQVTHAMLTEASLWFGRVSSAVKADPQEFGEQAMGKARVLASQYGSMSEAARQTFLSHVAHLYSRLATDSPGQVDEDQSGNAESQITDYDTDGNDDETFDEKINGELAPTGPVEVTSTRAPNISANSHLGARMAGRRVTAEGDTRGYSQTEDFGLEPWPDSAPGPQATDRDDWSTQDDTGASGAPEGTPGATSSLHVTAARPLYDIAREIRNDWKNVYFGAVPYLDALGDLDSMSDAYGADPASQIVAYFLSNATSWRGETARRIKAELNQMLKTGALQHTAEDTDLGAGMKDAVEVGSKDDRSAWPWELDELPGGTDGAADVGGVHTPGQSEADYPQPKAAQRMGTALRQGETGTISATAGFPLCAAGCQRTISAHDLLVNTAQGLAHIGCVTPEGVSEDEVGWA